MGANKITEAETVITVKVHRNKIRSYSSHFHIVCDF